MPPKKKPEPSSLGEVTAGHFKSSIEGLTRLASQHPSVRYILDVLTRLRERPYATNAIISRRARDGQGGARAHAARAHASGRRAAGVGVDGRTARGVGGARAVRLVAAPQGRSPRRRRGRRGRRRHARARRGHRPVAGAAAAPARPRQARPLPPRASRIRERVAQVNVVVITDGNLAGEVQAGRFRHDLLPQAGAPRPGAAALARAPRGRAGRGALDGQPRAARSRAAGQRRARRRRRRRGRLGAHSQGRDRCASPAPLAGQLPRARDRRRARAHVVRRRHQGDRAPTCRRRSPSPRE